MFGVELLMFVVERGIDRPKHSLPSGSCFYFTGAQFSPGYGRARPPPILSSHVPMRFGLSGIQVMGYYVTMSNKLALVLDVLKNFESRSSWQFQGTNGERYMLKTIVFLSSRIGLRGFWINAFLYFG